ncbi:hypothetical protein ACX80D_01180 [Arthrobacter sp. Sr24]
MMTKDEVPAALSSEEEARYQRMADWAETEMPLAPKSASGRRGSEAAAHGRSVLLEAGMDPAELDRLIGGRPSLNPDAATGEHSPHLNLRVTADTKQQIRRLADERGVRPSEMARELLAVGLRELQRTHSGSTRQEEHPA